MTAKRHDRGKPCPTCRTIHPRCLGHNRSGKPCRLHQLADQEVCHLHGGRSPQALVHAEARALQRQAESLVRKRWDLYGDQPIDDPLSELARLAGEVVAWKDMLREQVQQLDGVLAYWVDRDYMGPDGEVARSEAAEQLRAIVIAYERGQDRAAKILADMVKLDLAGRIANVRESQAAVVVACVRAGLAALDYLTPAQRVDAEVAVADQLAAHAAPDINVPLEITP